MINLPHDQQQKTKSLRRLTKKMEMLAVSNEFTKLSKRNQNKLIRKVQSGIDQLKPFFTIRTVRKTVTAAIAVVGLLIGITKISIAQNFGPMQINPFGIDTTNLQFVPTAADLDGDGDIDLLVGEYRLGVDVKDNILFFENIGTADSASFAAPIRSPFGLGDSTTFLPAMDLADLDGDGDLDCIVSRYLNSDSLCYYENIGSATTPDFGPKQLNPFGISLVNNMSIKFVDIDGDGDYDLLGTKTGYTGYDGVVWYKNNGTPTNPAFSQDTILLVNTSYSAYGQLSWVDIDHDGDYDLFHGSMYNGISLYGGVIYYENTGNSLNPSFVLAETFPFGLNEWGASTYYAFLNPEFADMDNDGDYDALIGAWHSVTSQNAGFGSNAGMLEYFEDTTGDGGINNIDISLKDNNDGFLIDVYPNPASEKVIIKTSGNYSKTIKLFNLHGVLIREEKIGAADKNRYTMELSDLAAGIYYLTAQAGEGYGVRKLVVAK